jgi:glutamate carboxypeptidase
MHDYQSKLQWLDDQQQSMRDLLTTICNINSGTFNVEGIAKIQSILEQQFSPLADQHKLIPLEAYQQIDSQGNQIHSPLGPALWLEKNADAQRQVLLCIHCDTVYDLLHTFQKCDVLPQDSNRLRGPGVADAKGGIVVMLFALKCLAESSWQDDIGWQVLINSDEEIGSPGSVKLFESLLRPHQTAMLFEPAYPDGSLVAQRKGSGNFSFVIHGHAAHAGREFHLGRNALVKAAELAGQIHAFNGVEADVTLNVGRIDGGGALNVVPDLAILRVNARVVDFRQATWVEQQFAAMASAIEQQAGFRCELHGYFSSPPKVLDTRTKKIQQQVESAAAELQIATPWLMSGGASDGNKFAALDLPNIDTLGVVGGNIHSDREYVELNSLVPRAKLAALMLMKYASGEFEMP